MGHLALDSGGKRNVCRILVRKPGKKKHFADRGLGERIILTHCGRVTQICVFNTVKLGTSASSP